MSVRDNQMINQNTDAEMEKLAALLGGTADDGGTPDAGTLMAKLNALLEAFEKGVTAQSVKSVQRGTITIALGKASGTATINAVDTSKAVVLYGGEKIESQYALESESEHIALVLTNSTTVTASYQTAQSGVKIYVPFQIIEFH